jgi:hypothetical protein
MKSQHIRRSFAKSRALLATVVVAWPGVAVADDRELAQAIEDASADLASGDWRDAQAELSKVQNDLKQTQDSKLYGQYLFYSALAYQQWAGDPKAAAADREAARRQAIRKYEDYLKSNPESGGAMNNLAQLYGADDAQRDRAIELLDRASAMPAKDGRAGIYAVNRARLLATSGRQAEALDAALKVQRSDRDNEAAKELTLELLRAGDAARFAEYQRELNRAGQVKGSLEIGLDEIDRRASSREPVLVALVETLGNPSLTEMPEHFLESEFAKRLGKHAGAADIGPGVSELLRLHEKPGTARDYPWWRRDHYEYEELQQGSRAAALLQLAHALGDRCRLAGKDRYSCAESYYRFAIEFTGKTADPSAFLSLAEILANSGRGDELATIGRQYERALFRGKGDAYSKHNLPKIFEFHLALGVMYGYLGKWTDPQFAPGGATWQLDRARKTAADFNRTAPADQQLHLPPQAVTTLSEGYQRAGDADNSVQVRVEAAENYMKKGDKQRAQQVLDPAWRQSVPQTVAPPTRQRLEAAAAAAWKTTT